VGAPIVRTTTLRDMHSASPATTDGRSGVNAGNRFIDVPLSGRPDASGTTNVSNGKIVVATPASVNTSFHWKYLLTKQSH
jgi:hypothetical protein